MTSPSKTFQFKEVDEEGLETLRIISDAHHFNDWMYNAIRKFCNGNILEIGSGIGNISERLLRDGKSLTVSDLRSNYRQFLGEKFPSLHAESKILEIDLVDAAFAEKHSGVAGTFDTAFALNVIEHIQQDSLAIANAATLLKPGGKLIILVPAFNSLYNQLDLELHHYKRYNRPGITKLLNENNLQPVKTFYFNAAGVPAWFISGKIQKNKTIPENQMALFNKMVPLVGHLDKLFSRLFGLSLICVAEKK